MTKEEIRRIHSELEHSGVMQRGENLLSFCLRMLNAEDYNTSELSRLLAISRFKLTRFLEAHGYERRVLWLSNA